MSQITVTGSPLGKTTMFNLVVNAQPFDYTLPKPNDITVTQGTSGSTTLTVTRTAGTAQSVSFTPSGVSGLPSGATAALSPGACTPNPTCTSQLTITTTASTPIGTFPITVTGNPLSKTTIFNLVVNAGPFDYELPKPNDITVTQGTSGSTTLTATLTSGTAQSVSFTASGLPSGATASFSPGACTPTCTSQLTITTTASTPTGTFPITVTGNPLSKTTTLSIAVTAQQVTTAPTTYTDVMRDIFVPSCLQCHSSTLSGAARNAAPVGVDFNTFAKATSPGPLGPNNVRANVRIQEGTMPPTGGLSANLQGPHARLGG